MSDPKGQDRNARIGLTKPTSGTGPRLELKKTVDGGMVRQSFSHGRSKPVAVEVKRTRTPPPAATPAAAAVRPAAPPVRPAAPAAQATPRPATPAPAPAAPPRPVPAAATPSTPEIQAPVAVTPVAPTPAAAPTPSETPREQAPAVAAAPAAPAETATATPATPTPSPAQAPAASAPVTPPVASAPAPTSAPRPTHAVAAPAGPRPTASAPMRPAGSMSGRPGGAPAGYRSSGPSTGGNRGPGGPSGRSDQPHRASDSPRPVQGRPRMTLKPLTEDEKAVRLRALSEARKGEEEARRRAEENARRAAEEIARRRAEEEAAAKRKAEEEARKRQEEETKRRAEELAAKALAEEERRHKEDEARRATSGGKKPATDVAVEETAEEKARRAAAGPRGAVRALAPEDDDERKGKARGGKPEKRPVLKRPEKDAKRPAKIVLDREAGDIEERRVPSLAAMRRHRERERRQAQAMHEAVQRDVVLPETITVQDLAARMAVRGAEVIKVLMKNGILATINQTIDADTAELVVSEFGHRVRRVTEGDVELGIEGEIDDPNDMLPRAPVVTVMGHVDHGKTSLLDALRSTDVAAGEAGGITQHIGAYQVDIGHGRPVTFIDTPGHAAFTAMRARGAAVTDVVVLVVAADDGVMPQTIEAIRHAKAANVPMIVAINKIDKPEANPERVKSELLSHEVVLEDFGGEVLSVEVSATKKIGLDKLIELIQLQAELLDLRANPSRAAQGTIIEAKLDRGRGVAATVLIQRGTLKVGDLVVAGAQWGRVRAILNDRMDPVDEAGPSMPVEILGLDGVPDSGDLMVVLDSEKRAREVAEYRQRKKREQQQVVAAGTRGSTLEDMFSALRSGLSNELAVVVKSDVHGSLEAITAGLDKLKTDEVAVRILHGGVGAITESDVTLAMASKALIIGFNVRANAQAREMAKREGIEIRYYSIIYELLDELKQMLSGMLAPEAKEVILGHAEIREVFQITKIGKVAGCRVVDGLIKRTAKARLLRDDVVVYEGMLGSLKRFKDDVREVREGFECGMSLEGYNDIRQGDVIEAFEVQEVARSL